MVASWYSAGSDKTNASTDFIDGVISRGVITFSKYVNITGGIVQKPFVGFANVL